MISDKIKALAHDIWETPLGEEEFERRLAQALSEEEEIENAKQLIRWFKRRYPTAGERLRYARKMYAAWMRPLGEPRPPGEPK